MSSTSLFLPLSLSRSAQSHALQNQTAATTVASYARERGGDAPRLIVGGARVRALADKWGAGRLLEPVAIRELLGKEEDANYRRSKWQRMGGDPPPRVRSFF